MLEITKRSRARAVLQARKEGKELKELANDFNLTAASISKILKAAKEEYLLDKEYKSPKERFFEKLRQKTIENNGVTPTRTEINEDERFESANAYVHNYGEWVKLCREAGLEPNGGNGYNKGYNPELDPRKAG